MKKLYFLLILPTILVLSCQKNQVKENNEPNTTPETLKPTAAFKVTNEAATNAIWEFIPVKFENNSSNAESYLWDFGNGVTSTEKVPTDVSYVPCGTQRTITLTVKNKSGQTSSYAVTYDIACSRGIPGGRHSDH